MTRVAREAEAPTQGEPIRQDPAGEARGQPEAGHHPRSPHSSAEPGSVPVGIHPTEENPGFTTNSQGALGEHTHRAGAVGPVLGGPAPQEELYLPFPGCGA